MSAWLFKNQAMRRLEISHFHIIKAGQPLTVEDKNLKSSIIKNIQKREEYVFWLQPKNGSLKDQIASLCINSHFYSINLRLEKLIFRHIRLSRNFVNVEKLQNGIEKLKIPTRLLKEKQRTSMRGISLNKKGKKLKQEFTHSENTIY